MTIDAASMRREYTRRRQPPAVIAGGFGLLARRGRYRRATPEGTAARRPASPAANPRRPLPMRPGR
jgi:hypothetical protein